MLWQDTRPTVKRRTPAAALGLDVPLTLLARADEVITGTNPKNLLEHAVYCRHVRVQMRDLDAGSRRTGERSQNFRSRPLPERLAASLQLASLDRGAE
jgi:hypothetical protein